MFAVKYKLRGIQAVHTPLVKYHLRLRERTDWLKCSLSDVPSKALYPTSNKMDRENSLQGLITCSWVSGEINLEKRNADLHQYLDQFLKNKNNCVVFFILEASF